MSYPYNTNYNSNNNNFNPYYQQLEPTALPPQESDIVQYTGTLSGGELSIHNFFSVVDEYVRNGHLNHESANLIKLKISNIHVDATTYDQLFQNGPAFLDSLGSSIPPTTLSLLKFQFQYIITSVQRDYPQDFKTARLLHTIENGKPRIRVLTQTPAAQIQNPIQPKDSIVQNIRDNFAAWLQSQTFLTDKSRSIMLHNFDQEWDKLKRTKPNPTLADLQSAYHAFLEKSKHHYNYPDSIKAKFDEIVRLSQTVQTQQSAVHQPITTLSKIKSIFLSIGRAFAKFLMKFQKENKELTDKNIIKLNRSIDKASNTATTTKDFRNDGAEAIRNTLQHLSPQQTEIIVQKFDSIVVKQSQPNTPPSVPSSTSSTSTTTAQTNVHIQEDVDSVQQKVKDLVERKDVINSLKLALSNNEIPADFWEYNPDLILDSIKTIESKHDDSTPVDFKFKLAGIKNNFNIYKLLPSNIAQENFKKICALSTKFSADLLNGAKGEYDTLKKVLKDLKTFNIPVEFLQDTLQTLKKEQTKDCIAIEIMKHCIKQYPTIRAKDKDISTEVDMIKGSSKKFLDDLQTSLQSRSIHSFINLINYGLQNGYDCNLFIEDILASYNTETATDKATIKFLNHLLAGYTQATQLDPNTRNIEMEKFYLSFLVPELARALDTQQLLQSFDRCIQLNIDVKQLLIQALQEENKAQNPDARKINFLQRILNRYDSIVKLPQTANKNPHNLQHFEILKICLVAEDIIENTLRAAEDKFDYYKKSGYGISKSLLINRKTGDIIILNKKDILGAGTEKKVTTAIYNSGTSFSSDLLALAVNKKGNHALSKKEIEYAKQFQGVRGLASIHKYTQYTSNAQKRETYTTELFDNDLSVYFEKDPNKRKTATFNEKVRMLEDIAYGIEHMHSSNIVHGDLKPLNIGIKNKRAKIFDYGAAYKPYDGEQWHNTIGGGKYTTLMYSAPETFNPNHPASQHTPGKEQDMYAIGVTAYELMFEKQFPAATYAHSAKKAAYENYVNPMNQNFHANQKTILDQSSLFNQWIGQNVISRLTPPNSNFPLTKDQEFEQIILQTMHPDPTQRLTATQLRQKIEAFRQRYNIA